MKIKKLIYILIFLTLTNCGYNSIYSNSNDFKIAINKIQLEGDKKISRKIISKVNLKEDKKGLYSYNLNLNTKKNIETVAKDKTGNASIYRTTVTVSLTLTDPNNQNQIYKQKEFSSSFSYNSLKDRFSLLQYQKNIEVTLIERISEEITIFINSTNDN